MALPKFEMPRATVQVLGEDIEVRGLSRKDMHRIAELGTEEGEAWMIARACGVELDEARDWLATVPVTVADVILAKAIELSGVDAGNAPSED